VEGRGEERYISPRSGQEKQVSEGQGLGNLFYHEGSEVKGSSKSRLLGCHHFGGAGAVV